jgi:hypothetical protein
MEGYAQDFGQRSKDPAFGDDGYQFQGQGYEAGG